MQKLDFCKEVQIHIVLIFWLLICSVVEYQEIRHMLVRCAYLLMYPWNIILRFILTYNIPNHASKLLGNFQILYSVFHQNLDLKHFSAVFAGWCNSIFCVNIYLLLVQPSKHQPKANIWKKICKLKPFFRIFTKNQLYLNSL